jgi:hypothetical protein
MKKVISALVGVCWIAGTVAIAAPSESDQKWLDTVQKMVERGNNRVTTPSNERVNLVKDWSAKSGMTVKVTQAGSSYTMEITSSRLAKN